MQRVRICAPHAVAHSFGGHYPFKAEAVAVDTSSVAVLASRPADARCLAVSYEFVKEADGQDWGDVWVWDLEDPCQRTVEWLGLLPRRKAEQYARARGYPLYRHP